jgi:hypothetical protein
LKGAEIHIISTVDLAEKIIGGTEDGFLGVPTALVGTNLSFELRSQSVINNKHCLLKLSLKVNETPVFQLIPFWSF